MSRTKKCNPRNKICYWYYDEDDQPVYVSFYPHSKAGWDKATLILKDKKDNFSTKEWRELNRAKTEAQFKNHYFRSEPKSWRRRNRKRWRVEERNHLAKFYYGLEEFENKCLSTDRAWGY